MNLKLIVFVFRKKNLSLMIINVCILDFVIRFFVFGIYVVNWIIIINLEYVI